MAGDEPVVAQGRKRTAPHAVRVERLLKAKAATSGAINRLVFTLSGLAFFVLVTHQYPDTYLLTTGTTVNLPIAGPASFKTFLVLLPVALLGVRAYLEVFVAHWRRLERVSRAYRTRDTPVASPLGHPLLRLLTWLELYPLVPAVLALLVLRARAFFGWGLAMLALALVTAIVLLKAAPLPRRLRHLWLGALLVAAALWSMAYVNRGDFQRQLNLRLADLQRAHLIEEDLRGADLRGADLRSARLAGANLTGADLTQADLRDANLTGANLTKAVLERADLRGAIRSRADVVEGGEGHR